MVSLLSPMDYLDRTQEIIALEAEANNSEVTHSLESIAKTYGHKGTVMYAIRVLSKLGYDKGTLLDIARDYNKGRAKSNYLIDNIWIVTKDGDFEQVYLSECQK